MSAHSLLSQFNLFIDPASRFFYLHLLSSFLLALAFYLFTKKKFSDSIYFKKDFWKHKSISLDLKIFIFNTLFKGIFITPFIIGSFKLSLFFLDAFTYLKLPDFEGLLDIKTLAIIYTFIAFLFNDFLRFFMHFLMHRIPFLWHFHRVHHTAERLTPLSLLRAHPVELILAQFRNLLTVSLISAGFAYLFKINITPISILGVNAFGFLFNFLGSNLRHSHVPLSYGSLEVILISPKQHQVHHSDNPKHYHANYGICLSLWDQIFKSIVYSKDVGDINYGVGEVRKHTLINEYIEPFQKLFKLK